MTGGGALVDGVEAAEEFLSESVLSPLCTVQEATGLSMSVTVMEVVARMGMLMGNMLSFLGE